jgi:hypothetical protein
MCARADYFCSVVVLTTNLSPDVYWRRPFGKLCQNEFVGQLLSGRQAVRQVSQHGKTTPLVTDIICLHILGRILHVCQADYFCSAAVPATNLLPDVHWRRPFGKLCQNEFVGQLLSGRQAVRQVSQHGETTTLVTDIICLHILGRILHVCQADYFCSAAVLATNLSPDVHWRRPFGKLCQNEFVGQLLSGRQAVRQVSQHGEITPLITDIICLHILGRILHVCQADYFCSAAVLATNLLPDVHWRRPFGKLCQNEFVGQLLSGRQAVRQVSQHGETTTLVTDIICLHILGRILHVCQADYFCSAAVLATNLSPDVHWSRLFGKLCQNEFVGQLLSGRQAVGQVSQHGETTPLVTGIIWLHILGRIFHVCQADYFCSVAAPAMTRVTGCLAATVCQIMSK